MGNWKIWTVLGSVFFAGIVVGVVGFGVVLKHHFDGPKDPAQFRMKIKHHILEEIIDEVEPNPEAIPAITEIIDDVTLQLETFRRENHPRIRAIFENGKERISALLTPEQQERFEKFTEKRRKRKFGLFRLPPPPPPHFND